jgi:hypothetical protein
LRDQVFVIVSTIRTCEGFLQKPARQPVFLIDFSQRFLLAVTLLAWRPALERGQQ